MAIYHTSIKVFSRSKSDSAVAAAAYRSGLSLRDEATEVRHDYTRRNGVVANLFLAPKGAPEWTKDPAALWNAAQAAERRKDAVLAREFEVSLPHELNDMQRHKLVEAIAQALVDRYGFAIQASIHAPDEPEGKNHHVHLLATTRRISELGFGKKTRELDGGNEGRRQVEWVRAMVADRINHHLADAGLHVRVDHRRLEVQAIEALKRGDLDAAAVLSRRPTQHEGQAATAMENRGEVSERRQANERIARENSAQLSSLLAAMRKEGRLMETPASHSHAAAVRDVSKGSTTSGTPATVSAPPRVAGLRMAGATKRVYYKTGDAREDALTEARRAREEEIERLLFDALRIWQDGLNEVLRKAVGASSRVLFERDALVRQYAHKRGFLLHVRDLHNAYAQADRDTSRFRRRMAAQERAKYELCDAENDLAEFDFKHPRPGLWSRREWAERRRAQVERVRLRKEACAAATAATDPEAQTRYWATARKSLENLKRVSQYFASDFILEPSDAAPSEVAVEEVEADKGEEAPVRKGRRGAAGKLNARPMPTPPKSEPPRARI